MSNKNLQNLSEVEKEFIGEIKGEGSLTVSVFGNAPDSTEDEPRRVKAYLDYDIHLQDIEALFFEGIKLPRWGSITAETVEQQTEIYNESFGKVTAAFPLISRVSDTDQKVSFAPEEIAPLREECERVADDTDSPKAVRALQKIYLACEKAAEKQMGILLVPSS